MPGRSTAIFDLTKPATTSLRLLGKPACALLMCAYITVAGAKETHRYQAIVDGDLSRLSIEARFADPIHRVSARSRDAARYISGVRDCDTLHDVRTSGRNLVLPERGLSCLSYTVDLAQAAKDNRQNRTLAGDNVVVSPSAWLWRPEIGSTTVIEVQFQLPDGIGVSVPWHAMQNSESTYQIRRSPESSNAPVVFGKFDQRSVAVPGATLRVSLLNSKDAMNNDAIIDWVQAAATDVSLAYGRFPNPAAQIVVFPVGNSRGRSDSAVPFGRVVRDGGETVELFVNQNRPLADYLDDWTATHEFSHLMVPFLGRKHRWISEGFAQYYQNVLLTRSGAYDDIRAWQKIYDGLERGRRSSPDLSPNRAAEDGVRKSLMKVYWSGAAIALMADVALRDRSSGAESLDTVLDRLQACCLPGDRAWSGEEMFRQLDSLTDYPVFADLYQRYANATGFPDTSHVFEQLGIEVRDDRVSLQQRAPLKHIRLAIMETDARTSAWRRGLVSD